MTITLDIPAPEKAAAVRELTEDLRGLVKLRMKRPQVTAAGIVAAGQLLNVLNEIDSQLESVSADAEEVPA